VLERKLQLLERKGWLEGVEHRRDALDRLLPTVRAASDPITRDLYIGTIADRLRLSRDVLEREVNAAPPEPLRPPAAPERHGPPVSVTRPVRGRAPAPGARTEATVLRAILADRTWLGRARDMVPVEQFEVAAYRAIYQGLLDLPERAPVSDLLSRLDPAAAEAFTRLQGSLDGREGYRWDEEFIAAVERLQHRASQRDIDKITDPTERAMRLRERSSSADLGRRLLKTAAPLRRPPARPSRADSPPEE
jgi:DNA primase